MEEINPLSRLAERARRKFNKTSTQKVNIIQERRIEAQYVFKRIDTNKKYSELINKVHKILEKDPDVINPIGQLIDNNLFKNLDDQGKERYVQNLTNDYLKVLNK